jgi:tetratricopeptide (TPR) repeat protein
LEDSTARVEKAHAQITVAWLMQIQGQIKKSIMILEKTLVILQDGRDVWGYVLAIAQLAWGFLSIGEIQKGEALYQKGFRLVEPGDLRLGTLLRNGLARASCLQGDYAEAERLLNENLELCFQLGSKRQTALCYLYLGQVALASDRTEMAERNFQGCVDLQSEFGESHDLALGLVYLGKCFAVQQETEKARAKFQQAIHIGQTLDIFHLVYWGLINLARILMLEGQPEKALEMALILRHYSVEFKVIQDDSISLLEELQTRLTPQQVESAMDRTEGVEIESLLESII